MLTLQFLNIQQNKTLKLLNKCIYSKKYSEYTKIKAHLYNTKSNIRFYTYFQFLWQLFIKKKIFISKIIYFLQNEYLFIIIHLYFSYLKLKKLKKKLRRLTKVKKKKYLFNVIKKTGLLHITENKKTKKNIIFNKRFLESNMIKKVISKYIPFLLNLKKKTLKKIFKKFTQIFTTLYKNYKLIVINIIYSFFLLLDNKRVANILLYHLSCLFSLINKKSHNFFFSIIRKLFKYICNELKKLHKIRGFRLVVSGRLSGKTRSNTISLATGITPINKNLTFINFATRPAYSKLGSFGMKIWICYQP